MPTLNVKRDSGYADSIRAYKLFLDGIYLDKIRPGETKTYEISSGEHTIHGKIDWCSTSRLVFHADDTPQSFEIYSKLRGRRLFTAFLAIFNPQGWIGMRQSNDLLDRDSLHEEQEEGEQDASSNGGNAPV